MSNITLSGTIFEDKDGDRRPLTDAAVRAVNLDDRSELTVRSDDSGNYTIQLPAGRWRVAVTKAGYGRSEPASHEQQLTADKPDLAFVLSETATIRGTVQRHVSNERVPGAIVTARPHGTTGDAALKITTSDDDGDFQFGDLSAGRWVVAAQKAGFFATTKDDVNAAAGVTTDLPLSLRNISGDNDMRAGWRYLIGLIVAWIFVLVIYLALHSRIASVATPASTAMVTLVDAQSDGLENAVAEAAESETAVTLSDNAALITGLGLIRASWVVVSDSVSTEDQLVVAQLLGGVDQAVAANDVDGAREGLSALRSIMAQPRDVGFFWRQEPWSFVEVAFWAILGVLAYQIGISSWYLRWRRFYPEGIPMHLSQLITVPLLALVVSWLLTLASLSFRLGENEVRLDLSDPRILAAFAFLLGFQPWNLRDFLTRTAARVLGLTQEANGA